jgi:DNA-binding CsgD family transcriptional regulator
MLTRYINLKKDQLTTVILTNTKKKILLRVLQGVSTIQSSWILFLQIIMISMTINMDRKYSFFSLF